MLKGNNGAKQGCRGFNELSRRRKWQGKKPLGNFKAMKNGGRNRKRFRMGGI